MNPRRLLPVALLCPALALLCLRETEAQDKRDSLAWIWSDDASLSGASSEPRYFRKVFDLKEAPAAATLLVTADNGFNVWVNGKEVGAGDEWKELSRFNVAKHLAAGKNVVAVEGRNEGGPAGLLVKLEIGKDASIVSDASWKASKDAPAGWQKAEFDDAKWAVAKVIAPYGEGPWGHPLGGGGKSAAAKKERFTVPAGFRVELVVPPGSVIDGFDRKQHNFSPVNMCFDSKGRLFASQEGGPIFLCTEPDDKGVFQKIAAYCTLVRNCHGMCWAHDVLYLVGDGPNGTGLYRCHDNEKDDKVEKVELLLKYKGGMGEHGPHAVVHGPDDKLYLVVGNHSWAQPEKLAVNSPLVRWPTGNPGPDQGKPGTTEDVLLPRQNDANGHAANILAPGGTIWRVDLDGKNAGLFSAGFRNQFDAAFNPDGELFTFDSDMEWDEGLPWYRHVRVCHCTPGADFVWRTGAANTPNYYADSLPPTVETGRGSPTGVEFYDHPAFPARYRGVFFMCDWSIGVIWAVHLQRDGASYKGKAEKFCVGAPLPASDCAVGPDGALYFTLGGRNTQGGIYRIVYEAKSDPSAKVDAKAEGAKQPLAPWSSVRKKGNDPAQVLQVPAGVDVNSPENRARGIYLMGVKGGAGVQAALLKALKDPDALVRRRACEALVRQDIDPPVRDLRPLLADKDRFLRTAARLVLQRIDPKLWAAELVRDNVDTVAHEAIIALCKIGKAAEFTAAIMERLHDTSPGETPEQVLEWLRTIQLALIHTTERPDAVRGIALDCRELFPHKDKFVNRELAILLTEFGRTKEIDPKSVVTLLTDALKAAKDDRPQQIHLFYCLRLLRDGWTPEQKSALLAWYDSTRSWTGGNSFSRFLENILRDLNPSFTPEERAGVWAHAADMPQAALALLRITPRDQLPAAARLKELYAAASKPNLARGAEFKSAVVDALKSHGSPEAKAALRELAKEDPSQRVQIVLALLPNLAAEDFALAVDALADKQIGQRAAAVIDALRTLKVTPKPDEPRPFRAVLFASRTVDEAQRWKAVELLRAWSGGRQFGAEKADAKKELASWGKWFNQAFPKETPLPDLGREVVAESKYKFAELAAFLEKDPKGKGDAARGKAVFTKAQCIKCHKFGSEGEGIGPDLSMVSKRFKRAEVLETIFYPSKVISDQYRSSRIETTAGQTYTGLAAPMGDTVTVLLSDGMKVTLKKSEIATQFASLVSVMPEKLLDELTLEEIADLFAYMER